MSTVDNIDPQTPPAIETEPCDGSCGDTAPHSHHLVEGTMDRFKAWQDQHPLTTGNDMVQIAYLHGEAVSHSFAESLRRAWQYDREIPVEPVLAENPINIRSSSARVVSNRNFATKLFQEKTPHEWLMFIDADMGFEPDAIHRLLAAADPVDRPIVGGLCFAMYDVEADGFNGYRSTIVPTMYRLGTRVSNDAPSLCFYGPYEPDTMTEVAATGAAFLLIHRSVFERVAAAYPQSHIWDEMYDSEGDIIGEDMSFCLKARSLNIPVFVHTGVKTTHHKGQWLGEEAYVRQEAIVAVQEVVPDLPDGLPTYIDVSASLASVAANAHVQNGMLKHPEDMTRYRRIIEDTKPEVIVETGTHTGATALWLRRTFDVDVVTVDVRQSVDPEFYDPEISYVWGNSVDPSVVELVRSIVDGRRCMVILDSDHSAKHVAAELAAYAGLVSPECYLVVEDGIFGYASKTLRDHHFPDGLDGSPLEPIAEVLLPDARHWVRDIGVERMSPISHHPAGWWMRVYAPETDEVDA
jgi:cephalosporin hydroxylase